MPRRSRIHLDGVPLHIVQRGHNREPCFFAEDDYSSYLHWLGEALTESGCALHAYVLMTNHVHLLITPTKAEAVPKFIISLGRRYVQYINRSYRRTGTLWDSRYKSSLVSWTPSRREPVLYSTLSFFFPCHSPSRSAAYRAGSRSAPWRPRAPLARRSNSSRLTNVPRWRTG